MNEEGRLSDQIALVSALAEHVQATLQRDLSEAALVRLARRLVEDTRLSDAEAVRLVGREALAAVRALRGTEVNSVTEEQETK